MQLHFVWRQLSAQSSCILIYPQFELRTDTPGEAFGAFLTCVVIAGGIGPAFVLIVLWLGQLGRRGRG